MRIRQHDGEIERSDLFDPGRTRHLTVAVERIPTRRTWSSDAVASARQDCGDAGSHGPAPDLHRPIALDQRDGSDLDAWYVGDRIELPWQAL
jgi:hypothetical protein